MHTSAQGWESLFGRGFYHLAIPTFVSASVALLRGKTCSESLYERQSYKGLWCKT